MSANHALSRRRFVAATAAIAANLIAQNRGNVPVGLQVSALGKNMEQDPSGTLRAVAKMGYDLVEFPTEPYMHWEPARLKEIRATLDSLHLPCRSTRGEIISFTGEGLRKTIELNRILGADTLVSVRGPQPTGGRGPNAKPVTLDGWKNYFDIMHNAAEQLRADRMVLGFHNHDVEFKQLEDKRPLDLLAANNDFVAFHLNLGWCLRADADPVEFCKVLAGKVQSIQAQDYQGKARWKEVFAAAEGPGKIQFYLIQRASNGLALVQREGNDLIDFAKKDLDYFKQLHR